MAAAGYDLRLVARSLGPLDDLAAELRHVGRQVETCQLDLCDTAAIAPAISDLCARGPVPDVVINNAGAAWTGPLAAMPLDRWQWLLQLNLTSVFQVCQAMLPALRQAGGGLIINVSSHAAHNAFSDWGAYCTTKAALVSFSRCLAATASGFSRLPWISPDEDGILSNTTWICPATASFSAGPRPL